jgi:hypothetical protein
MGTAGTPSECRSIDHPLLSVSEAAHADRRTIISGELTMLRGTLNETALLGFCELLNRWRDTGHADELRTAFATIEATMMRGNTDAAELMARALSAVAGVRVAVAMPDAPSAYRMH